MVAGKKSPSPLKLSDVFAQETNQVASKNEKHNANGNKEECKENTKNILNKYRITESNKNGIVNMRIKKGFYMNNKNNNIKTKVNEPNGIEEGQIYNNSDINNSTKNIINKKIYKESNLLIANGASGLIVHNGIICLSKKGNQLFIVSSLKRSYCIYDPHKLRKAYSSGYFSEDIKNLYIFNGYVYIIFNKKTYKINDTEEKKIFNMDCHKYNIIDLLIVSDYLLTYSKKEIIIWDDSENDESHFVTDSYSDEDSSYEEKEEKEETTEEKKENFEEINETEVPDATTLDNDDLKNKENSFENKNYLYKSIILFDDESSTEINKIIHPDGYTNKILILTNENKLYLYNINKEKIIHEYNCINNLNLNNYKHIKLMSKTNKNDEICIVTTKNELYIINIEKDEIIYSKNIYMNDDLISCVNFYNYKEDGEMVSIILLGTEHGKILMINEKNIQYFTLRNVHDYVKTILVAPNGYIYSAGYDNKINLLNFNKNLFTLEIMKKRNSCVGIVNKIKYLDDENYKLIVSANLSNSLNEGNLFIISPNNPEQNREFSWSKKIKALNKNIIDFDINTNRHYDWNNILICLENSDRVYLGSSYKKVIENEYLSLPLEVIEKAQRDLNVGKKKQKMNKNSIEADESDNDKENILLLDGKITVKNVIKHVEEEYKIYDENNNDSEYLFNTKKKKYATSVLISTCGHIGIVGYNDGEIHSFNIQSTTYRSEYKLNKYSIKSKAHINGEVLKLYLYGINHFVSAVNSEEDTCLRVWNIYTGDLTYTYNIKNEYKLEENNNSEENIKIQSFYHYNILTVACLSNNNVLILDIEQKCITRKLKFLFSVTNVTFSKDNRLILFALDNKALLIYEIISNTFIDYLLFKNHIIYMIYNDINLYTAHHNSQNFIYSFTNKNLFNNNNYVVNDYKLFNAMPFEQFSDSENENNSEHPYRTWNLDELTMNTENVENDTTHLNYSENDENNSNLKSKDKHNYIHVIQPYVSSENQINKNLLTMSGYTISKIAYLIFLDKIKENCRVEENVKKNEDIPFFLSAKLDSNNNNINNIEYIDEKEDEFLKNITEENPNNDQIEDQTVEEINSNNKESEQNENEIDNKQIITKSVKKSKRITKNIKDGIICSKLQEMIGKTEESYNETLKYLKSLSPSGVHFNILSLSTKKELENMMNFFIYHVKTNDNIDLIQSYILIFLKTHGKKLLKAKEKNLQNSIRVLLQEVQKSWSSVNVLFENIIFFINFLTNIQME
ncbi:U3 small nucleolar RNA-associated protein 21, putative [Plasmodium yoelii]|uniref:U3 small nucleolar RNA-associated protein 21 n=2 Tax=Plasmodium yoelii TaxID=5861 RepID=A0AAF0B1D1_PLAYO|nr:U3 small nucleolar RNA-associated protein 21, putative [Plasmodium yoelii]WBY58767.1 U3 small nucleolar RNA-associated protein 21 [Plasmodium yoelii yoelii]CDU19042.1 U3 snoRNA-associated small subunit rRNA processing protein, putative [Plasmodium yoelii]VTZ79627.1 U3 small nucleolar RNA-associated protein 21, putative [Plasmodium yoelii]|eukprot:XP_022812458.1 U3 small nucleolar RNA-associated protein 21, putative [Plasmodium yoelii]